MDHTLPPQQPLGDSLRGCQVPVRPLLLPHRVPPGGGRGGHGREGLGRRLRVHTEGPRGTVHLHLGLLPAVKQPRRNDPGAVHQPEQRVSTCAHDIKMEILRQNSRVPLPKNAALHLPAGPRPSRAGTRCFSTLAWTGVDVLSFV